IVGVQTHAPAIGIELRPPVPNPFVSSTTISFTMPFDARVEMGVFDVKGRLVHELVDRHLPAGHHFVSWNGANAVGSPVPAGIYFYRLRVNGVNLTGRVLYLH
ncbi:MAG: T9SS type A sorting domain-containing protein, partial [Candidatus Latescibacterota bacterium]